jgi:hypothetical protein
LPCLESRVAVGIENKGVRAVQILPTWGAIQMLQAEIDSVELYELDAIGVIEMKFAG